MNAQRAILLLFLCFLFCQLKSQPHYPPLSNLYNQQLVPRIDITMDNDSLQAMLNNTFSEHEYPANFIFNDGTNIDTIPMVGVRLRGNTSQNAAKKSFKVSFNTFIGGRKYAGVEKINLNGEHNDPSIIRAHLYWHTAAAARIPAPRSNHVNLYINGTYRGVYINVEHIDEEFIQSRYIFDFGNLYKCLYPANLNYININPNSYKLQFGGRRVYELKNNLAKDNYERLAKFISTLNSNLLPNHRDSLERLFNVNGFLRCYALDILTSNWDNYAGNTNNFYLYENPLTHKIDYLPYDTDNTYGIDWFGIDWGTRDIYNWQTDANNRPLVTKLLAYQDYRDRFSFLMNKLIQQQTSQSVLQPFIDSAKNNISIYVAADPYYPLDYGFTIADFTTSYTQGIGGHVPYGIYDFITTRNNSALQQIQLNNIPPMFSDTRELPIAPHNNDTLEIRTWVEDEDTLLQVNLFYKINWNGTLAQTTMYDDGMHADEQAGDGIYGTLLPPQNVTDTVYYYIESTDSQMATGREPRSGYYDIAITSPPALYINEWCADNVNVVQDNAGDYDDFFEIYNNGSMVNTNTIYASDDFLNLNKWNLGDTTIEANKFLLCWADDEKAEGINHSSFKLNAAGEQIILSEYNGKTYVILDSVSYGTMLANQSLGYYPDATLPIITQVNNTPGFTNLSVQGIGSADTLQLTIFPNPTQGPVYILSPSPLMARCSIQNSLGQHIMHTDFKNKLSLNLSGFKDGMYFFRIIIESKTYEYKLLLMR